MNRRTLFRYLAAASAAAGAAGVIPEALAQGKKQVKISHATAPDLGNDNHMVAWIIANYINSYSDTLEARIYAANALGEERAVVEGMELGAGATMHIGGTAIHSNFNKRMGVLDLPFMWRDYDHAHRVLDGKVGQTLAAEHEKLGLRIIGWQDSWGYRNVVTTRKDVKKPEDLKGLKIRTIQAPTYVAALNAMGANATPMAFGEVYTALQTGVIDGFEHASAVVYTGGTIHGGGGNTTDIPRRGAHLSYCLGWLRTEENNYLAVPPAVAATLPRQAQEVLGYAVHNSIPRGGGHLGMLRMQDPVELLARSEL